MPTSVAIAVASSYAATAAGAYVGILTGSLVASTIASAVVGMGVSATLGSAFSDSGASPEAPQYEQQLRDNLVTVRQPISHWRYIYGRVRVGGALTFAHETADENFHLVITLAGHVCTEIEEIHFNDEVVPLDSGGYATGKYAGYVRIKKSLGDEAGQPFADLVAESEGKWTDAHRQSGRTKLYVRLSKNIELFPSGIPNITAVVKGKKVYDPRTGLTAYSTNASLCQADFICDRYAGLAAVYADEIDDAQLIAAANIDDEAVALAAGGTEARYTLNGTFEVNAAPSEVLGKLLTANSGKVRYIGGLFRVEPAAYAVPTITLTEDDLRGVPQISPRLSASDLANGVKGVYVSEDNLWQGTDFPPVTNATYLSEDGGERSWRELDLPHTKSAATAQRIAKIELERIRQQISVEWPGKFTCYRLQPGDTVMITFAMLGWSAKVFEVEQARLTFDDKLTFENNALGCDLSLRETASTVFDWNSGEETTVDPAPDTNLPDPFTVDAPGVPSVAETLYETTGSAGVKAKATVSWAASPDGYVNRYQLEYRVNGTTTWTVLPQVDSTTVELLDVAPGRYDFQVKGINQLGIPSDYATRSNVEILGLLADPADITGLSIQAAGGLAILTFDLSPDLDVRIGGKIRVRHSEAMTGAVWENSVSIGNAVNGNTTVAVLPLKAGTYLLKAEDSSGKQSVNAASVSTKQAHLLAFSTLSTVQEDATFSGTHSNTYVDGGALKLSGAGLFDDIPDFDAVASLDFYGGVNLAGTYAFASGMDLTSVKSVRLTGTIQAEIINVNAMIDSRTGNIDDWLDFDGTSGASADAWIEARETDDDPAGTPTWSAWKRLDAAEFSARAFQFRAQMTTSDPAYNINITQLRVAAASAI